MALALAAIGLTIPARAAAPSLEPAVKASYIYKFTPFIEWPATAFAPGSSFNICISGQDPFGPLIDEVVRGQRAKGRPIALRRLTNGNTSSGCHVLFLGRPVSPANTPLAGPAVLTISDSNSGAGSAMIQFVTEGSRIRFQIDDGAARAGGLTISSKLLGLALAPGRR